MLTSAIAIPLSSSIFHARPTHAQSAAWTATGNILLPRYSFQATTLPNGKVLIEGGFAPGSYTTDSELFDPATGVWTPTGSLNQGRGEHSATLLQDGRVLVAGGYAGPVLNSAELYDPATGTWTLTGSLSQVRTRHTATLLPNGKVLVAGGWNGDVISGAELYDPTTGIWSSAGNMLIPRAGQVAVLLANGKVLIAGGGTSNNQNTTESELYDPNTNTWTQTGSLNVLTGGTGVLLPNGKVLMAGDGTSSAELYDPATGTWTLTGSMQHARSAGLGMQALLLADGTVLIIGGDTAGTSEVYDPSSGTWDTLTNMVTPQCGGATAFLADGRALIAGGTDCTSPDNKIVTTELYGPATTPTPTPTNTPTPSPTPTPQSNRLFIFVDGVTTSLNSSGIDSSSFGLPNGIYQTLQAQYPTATFLMFSYTGSDSIGNPKVYSCQNTFDKHISNYVSLLRQQITSYMKHNPGTVVDIIGHSMGGVIAFGLLTDMVVNGFITTNGGHIDGIATMDSPLGGIPEGPGVTSWYLHLLTNTYRKTNGCEATTSWKDDRFRDLVDLTQVFGNAPYGTDDSLSLVINGADFSNLEVAQKAASNGVHVVTFENLKDYAFQPGDCPLPLPFAPHTHFIDTQLINDQGVNSGVYGRPFVAIATGGETCTSTDNIPINHGAVFSYQPVAADLLQFVGGNTPSQLI